MLLKITLLVLIISNILLWISHTKMKIVIGEFLKNKIEIIKTIQKATEDLK